MSVDTDCEDVDAILADTGSRQKRCRAQALKSLPKNCTSRSFGKKIAKYESSSDSRKPSPDSLDMNNTTEDRTDADNRLKEFIQGIRSTVIDGKEHWYDSKSTRAYTLQEIAHIMGVTRERVRQIEEAGLKRMWRLLSAMSRRENLKPTDWLDIAESKDGDDDTIYMDMS